jgi:hypothetical protein
MPRRRISFDGLLEGNNPKFLHDADVILAVYDNPERESVVYGKEKYGAIQKKGNHHGFEVLEVRVDAEAGELQALRVGVRAMKGRDPEGA